MSKAPTKVQFTVGKLDAGMAILLTQDHHQIEFPSILLPKTVTTGSIIDLSVSQNPEEEARVHSKFLALQDTIRTAFASKSPTVPVLSLRNATQTSAVLEWQPIDIATAELKSLTLWRDGTRLGNIPKPLHTTTTKLSGLAIDTDYTFQLVLRTTAGTYSSEPLKIRTHKLSNLSGITVCAGTVSPEQYERLTDTVQKIGAKPLQKRVRIDTTHFICSVPEGEEYQRAKEMNVPIVVVDWIEACQREGKIVGVRGYYLDADPALRPKISAPPASPPVQTKPPQDLARNSTSTAAPERSVPAPPKAEVTEASTEEAASSKVEAPEEVLHTSDEIAPPAPPSVKKDPSPQPIPETASETVSQSTAVETEIKESPPEKVDTTETAPSHGEEDKFDDVPI